MLTNVDCMRNYNFSLNNLCKHLIFINTKLTLGKTWSHLSIRTHKKSYIYASHTQNLLFNFSGLNKYIQKRFIILIIFRYVMQLCI